MIKILSYDNLINKMKEKGIEFNIVNEEEAKHFLKEHNYYIKISAYRFNFSKNPNTNKYSGLDFFHLKELSTIDMHLRFLILKTCLNIEHAIKVRLLKDMELRRVNENNIFMEYKQNNYKYINEITEKRSTKYTKSLIEKYSDSNKDFNCPIYVYLELASFGGLLNFFKFYNNKYNLTNRDVIYLLYKVKNIRNASAHNNCLINDLKSKKDVCYEAILLKDIKRRCPNFKEASIKKYIRNEFIQDFISMIYVLNEFVESDEIKKYRFKEFLELFNERMIRNDNKKIFKTAPIFEQRYLFLRKLLDNYSNNYYN